MCTCERVCMYVLEISTQSTERQVVASCCSHAIKLKFNYISCTSIGITLATRIQQTNIHSLAAY